MSAQKLRVESAQLPKGKATDHPVRLSNRRIQHNAKTGTSFAAAVTAPGNLLGTIDAAWSSDRLDIRRVSLRDVQSDAALSLRLTPRSVSVGFKGNLTKATLETLMDHDVLVGSLRGDFRSDINHEQPLRSTREGHLEARDVTVALNATRSVTVRTLTLDGVRNRLQGNAALDAPDGSHLQVRGSVAPTAQGLAADLDVTAHRLSWEAMSPWVAPRVRREAVASF